MSGSSLDWLLEKTMAVWSFRKWPYRFFMNQVVSPCVTSMVYKYGLNWPSRSAADLGSSVFWRFVIVTWIGNPFWNPVKEKQWIGLTWQCKVWGGGHKGAKHLKWPAFWHFLVNFLGKVGKILEKVRVIASPSPPLTLPPLVSTYMPLLLTM